MTYLGHLNTVPEELVPAFDNGQDTGEDNTDADKDGAW